MSDSSLGTREGRDSISIVQDGSFLIMCILLYIYYHD